jgi:hypothetical protein
MSQIVALARIVLLVAVVLSGCIWVPPGDHGGRGYYGGPQRGYGGGDRDTWHYRDRGEYYR